MPGQVLVSRRVLTTVEDIVDAEPIGELALRGLLKRVPAFSIEGLESPLVS